MISENDKEDVEGLVLSGSCDVQEPGEHVESASGVVANDLNFYK